MIVIISFMTIFTLENVDDGTIFTVALPRGRARRVQEFLDPDPTRTRSNKFFWTRIQPEPGRINFFGPGPDPDAVE